MSSHQVNATASSSKHKHKKDKDKSKKDKSKSKSKDRSSGSAAVGATGTTATDEDKSPFELRKSRMRMSVAPKYSADVMGGVRDKLDGMIMRYVPQMGGVLLAHWSHAFHDPSATAKLIGECPYAVCDVEFESIVWAPQIGQKLYGTHSLSSPSHLSLLFSKTFNVSIPLQHIPADLEFEHTDEAEDSDSDSDSELEANSDQYVFGGGLLSHGVGESGRWKDKTTGRVLGAGGKGIKFTVIGMQVTNQMLSLTGSLLADPSNPPPAPEPAVPIISRSPSLPPTPSPEPEQEASSRPAKQAHIQKQATAPAAAPLAIADEYSHLSAREQKQKRKEAEKAKRDARKAKKDDRTLEVVQDVGAEKLVDTNVTPVEPTTGEVQAQYHSKVQKRKADGEAGEKRKKKKEAK